MRLYLDQNIQYFFFSKSSSISKVYGATKREFSTQGCFYIAISIQRMKRALENWGKQRRLNGARVQRLDGHRAMVVLVGKQRTNM